ncbi:MAG: ATP-dependent helicase HrpB [Acidobacteria bacterium]|nr:ATP-dependent helicase HrpB [Acidobacteriota bacterium]
MLAPLPIDARLPAVIDALAARRAAVLVATPGAGKTTRVPPALVDQGRVLVLQPRRVAVRAVAARIAEERGWTLGREIGWHIRFEKRFAPTTPLVVVTEGILTARLQQDPLLSDVTTVVLDEFHERSIHADLGLALVRQAWLARDDLRVLVMSATLDTAPVARFLGGCPVIDVPGTTHPLTIDYTPGETVAAAVRHMWPRAHGHVLCFLPGAREIERARTELTSGGPALDADVLPLHGSLDGDAQDAALRPSSRRRVILATNLAETSLTVPGVSTVVDGGLVKVARYDAERGIDHLVTERVTLDSADQRAGRAARLGPGLARRLWDARDRLRPTREPDIARVDLSGPVLDLLVWGANPWTFEWFEAPRDERLEHALEVLSRLGAVEGAARAPAVTTLGRRLQRLPVHPRLARILVEGDGAFDVAAACALLSEGRTFAGSAATTTCDLLADIDRFSTQPPHVRQLARELQRVAGGETAREGARVDDGRLRRALFAGFADRLARRRAAGSDRLVLASGHGASLGRESGVRDGEFLVALDVTAATRDGAAEARVRMASAVDAAWITPTAVETVHRLDASSGRVKAFEVARAGTLVLSERPVAVDATAAAALLADAWLAATPRDDDAALLRRLRFAGLDVDLPALVRVAALGASTVRDIDLAAHLPFDVRARLDEAAPDSLPVPSGRRAPLTYAEDGTVVASVKLQELFGLADTPKLGPQRVPVTFSLLAPNGRPVQTTRDLRSFWQGAYQEVRRELRGRYPKHPWPEDPWTAVPTHRTTRALGKTPPAR